MVILVYYIGYIYMYGIGNHQQSYEMAIKWFENAAIKGNDSAMTMLGIINHYGKGVIIDLEKAKVWYEKASEKGDSIAMSNLGEIFRDGGEGVPKNTQKAIEWFEKAIKHGNEETKEKLLNLKLV